MRQGWNGGGRVAGRGLRVKWVDGKDGGKGVYGVGSVVPQGGFLCACEE